MTIETTKLLKLIQGLHDALLEIQVGGDPSKVRDQVGSDFASPSFQRGYLMGLERGLRCEGIPAFLSGAEVRIITGHINRIGLIFKVSEKEGALCQS
jgi:hypothetical protein